MEFQTVVVHPDVGALGYNASYAVFYYELKSTYLYECLMYSGIGMSAEAHPTIATVNAAMAAMMAEPQSLKHRELAFYPWHQKSVPPNTAMKKLLCRTSITSVRVACAADSDSAAVKLTKVRIACAANSDRAPNKLEAVEQEPMIPRCHPTDVHAHGGHVMMKSIHILFGLWGLAVLALHIQASCQPNVPQCVLQVHPWALAEPACYLAVLDCYRLGISGKPGEVEAKWSEFDRSTVVTLVIRHCPALGVSDMIGDFHWTTGIKVYNSTINDWGEAAALTNAKHPALFWFYLVRVNMTGGVLPLGIQSTDFPAKLYDLEFCHTNIRELPDDLDTKWLIGTTVYLEYCQLTSVPPVLFRMGAYTLALTVFWQWIDPLVERRLGHDGSLLVGGTPYSSDQSKLGSGDANSFSVSPSLEYSTMLMDPSNKEVIESTVDCSQENGLVYSPIDFEDSISALKPGES
ncbi:hypothetical protein ON010_g7480 [Phytophthora cinnamomi]|nr:hypothetical protein ON010_g7480 [Phytophthora cinnamomi]